jgi:deazaflavin-dependent oxidoreductase (nitroreductase family)
MRVARRSHKGICTMDDRIKNALQGRDVVIDITTIGRRSGEPRRIEIWFHNIDGRIIITGKPGPRNWLANLIANPQFTLHLKGDVQADLPATARVITDPEERDAIMIARFRGRDSSGEPPAEGRPMVEVQFHDAANA